MILSQVVALLVCLNVTTTTLQSVQAWAPRHHSNFIGRHIRSSSSATELSALGIRTVKRTVKRVSDSLTNQERSTSDLTTGIAGFYDRSSRLWENVWGEHMHHGYYVPENRTDHKQAQIDLMDEICKWAYQTTDEDNIPKVRSVVDVGCGIGGASRHLARKFSNNKCSTEGITLVSRR